MKIEDINLTTWFTNRQVTTHCPAHFILTKTLIVPEAAAWVHEKIHGRYCIVNRELYAQEIPKNWQSGQRWPTQVIAFEDRQDAVLYELTWS